MKNIICKIIGHKIVGLNTKRMFARCERCHRGLKVSYDMAYGETVVLGDYGDQSCFCWCECGNELCSSDSHVWKAEVEIQEGIVEYKCSKCEKVTRWDFNAPVPLLLTK